MQPGRKLAHLEGRRYASFNRSEWLTWLLARDDGVYPCPRLVRWRRAWAWRRGCP